MFLFKGENTKEPHRERTLPGLNPSQSPRRFLPRTAEPGGGELPALPGQPWLRGQAGGPQPDRQDGTSASPAAASASPAPAQGYSWQGGTDPMLCPQLWPYRRSLGIGPTPWSSSSSSRDGDRPLSAVQGRPSSALPPELRVLSPCPARALSPSNSAFHLLFKNHNALLPASQKSTSLASCLRGAELSEPPEPPQVTILTWI